MAAPAAEKAGAAPAVVQAAIRVVVQAEAARAAAPVGAVKALLMKDAKKRNDRLNQIPVEIQNNLPQKSLDLTVW
ncbi:hypothetical protein [uncultured Roseibium sp.]|uniref:hypothetical protein n=1 Tax=uncultured Roseibium sp. TaxID=1936171 RepID=UPI002613D4E4|nr:hypothetical protein [uncultured Roseibium sp.]